MSEQTKHTPGPWRVQERTIWPERGDAVASVPGGTKMQKAVAAPNASLIAAAPDLLEASIAFVAWMENNAGPGEEEDAKEQALHDDAITKARAAVAKAKGEQC